MASFTAKRKIVKDSGVRGAARTVGGEVAPYPRVLRRRGGRRSARDALRGWRRAQRAGPGIMLSGGDRPQRARPFLRWAERPNSAGANPAAPRTACKRARSPALTRRRRALSRRGA
jgi:hypothetical protein